jgi:hypothetical protein
MWTFDISSRKCGACCAKLKIPTYKIKHP